MSDALVYTDSLNLKNPYMVSINMTKNENGNLLCKYNPVCRGDGNLSFDEEWRHAICWRNRINARELLNGLLDLEHEKGKIIRLFYVKVR